MNPDTARLIERQPIVIGNYYPFFCEVQEEYKPAEKRLRQFTGQLVCVMEAYPGEDEETSPTYHVMAKDGTQFVANEEELNDWDRDLGQYFWPDATYGPDRSSMFLVNERAS